MRCLLHEGLLGSTVRWDYYEAMKQLQMWSQDSGVEERWGPQWCQHHWKVGSSDGKCYRQVRTMSAGLRWDSKYEQVNDKTMWSKEGQASKEVKEHTTAGWWWIPKQHCASEWRCGWRRVRLGIDTGQGNPLGTWVGVPTGLGTGQHPIYLIPFQIPAQFLSLEYSKY